METTDPRASCPGCGRPGEFDGPTHPYIGASALCWSTYGELLAAPGEKQDLVDAYAVQHPGVPGRREIQSVSCHLVSLCAALERGAEPEARIRLLRAAVARSEDFVWLEPPGDPGPVTALDVLAGSATGVDFATAVWEAWAEHHSYVRDWADLLVLRS